VGRHYEETTRVVQGAHGAIAALQARQPKQAGKWPMSGPVVGDAGQVRQGGPQRGGGGLLVAQ
jgi:hypothetical protein